MAERRMFARTIIDSDAFLDMPLSTQALYFHLSMRADDEGFVNNPRKIQRMIGASDDDCRVLIAKKFILAFESGIIVIKHWKIHNYIQSDRFKETNYKREKSQLRLDENKSYTVCIQDVSKMDTQVSIGKVSIGKDSIGESIIHARTQEETLSQDCPSKEIKHKYGEYKNVLLTDKELEVLNKEYGEQDTKDAIKYLDEYLGMKGTKYKSHYLAMKNWVYKAVNERKPKQEAQSDFMSKVQFGRDDTGGLF